MSISVAVCKQADPPASLSFPSTRWKEKIDMKNTSPSRLCASNRSNNRFSVSLATCFPAETLTNSDKIQAPHHPLVNFPDGPPIRMDPFNGCWHRKDKVVVVMGATGTGKSRLSIDLATRFNAEVVNSDKIQVYKGLDIVTNKVTEEEKQGIQHHLLGEIRPDEDFSATHFRHSASRAVASIVARNRLPIIAGGSNSFIEALVDDEELKFRSKYECCFIWVDVSLPVLYPFLLKRVDQMVKAGLVDEVRKMFKPEADYNRGIRRAIGVPELDQFLRFEQYNKGETGEDCCYESMKERLLDEAIGKIKMKTCELACRQLKKIRRLQAKWNVHRIDATDVFRCRGRDTDEDWNSLVVAPSASYVAKFLLGGDEHLPATAVSPISTVTSALARPIAVGNR